MNHNLIIRLKPVWSRSFSIAGVRPDWGVTKISYASILLLLLLALFSKFIQFFSKHSFSQKLHKSCKAPFWVTLLQQSKIYAQTPLRIQLCQEATNHTHKKWLERMRATFCRQKPAHSSSLNWWPSAVGPAGEKVRKTAVAFLLTPDRLADWIDSKNWGGIFFTIGSTGTQRRSCRKLGKNFSNFQSISAMVASDHSWFKKNQI